MSTAFSVAIEMKPAKNANSIAATPRRSRFSVPAFFSPRRMRANALAHGNGRRISVLSKYQLAAAGSSRRGHVQPRRGASAVRQDAAGPADGEIVRDQRKAGLAGTRLVD